MKNDLFLLVSSITITVLLSLGLIRWLAPELLGTPPDLRLVQADQALPPFYDAVFRKEHLGSTTFQVQDPHTRVRNLPLYPEGLVLGPHDLLGFRNRHVPNLADVIVIGDSQTYGNNAVMAENWPSSLEKLLAAQKASVYAMATGGWCGIQYADMFLKAQVLRPRVVIVAYYSGNDPLECFSLAYGSSHWEFLRPDGSLTASDAPRVAFPAPPELQWHVDFADGHSTTLTPDLRLASNAAQPAAEAGWAILRETARRIAEAGRLFGIQVVFTVVPTKELAYARRIAAAGIHAPAAYQELVVRERGNIEAFAASLDGQENARFVDVVESLQQAVTTSASLYPSNENGHPKAAGYRVIAEAIAPAVLSQLPAPPKGLSLLSTTDGTLPALVLDDGAWLFTSGEYLEANGWGPFDAARAPRQELERTPIAGVVRTIDRDRFGPKSR